MGFGLLLMGYFMTFLTSLLPYVYGYILRLCGYILMYTGLIKLSEFEPKFKLTSYTVIPLSLICVYRGGAALSQMMLWEVPVFTDKAVAFVGYGDVCFIFLFHLMLMLAVKSIALDTGLKKIATAAVRNFVFFGMYFTVYIVTQIPGFVDGDYIKYFTLILLVLQLAWMLSNLIMLFSCYKNICAEGDEDMPRKKSRFKWINDFYDELDRRQEKATKSQIEYIKEKREKRRNKKKK